MGQKTEASMFSRYYIPSYMLSPYTDVSLAHVETFGYISVDWI